MKIFWGIIAALALAAAGLLARGGGDRAPRERGPDMEALANIGASTDVPAPGSPAAAEAAASDREGESAEPAAEPGAVERDASALAASSDAERKAEPDAAEAPRETVAAEDTVVADPLPPGAPGHDAEAADLARRVAEQATAAREAAEAAAAAQSGPSIRINDNWTVPGDGSAENPYLVPWDVLVSAGREYNPREGKTELPAWATQLNGKHVQLTGFLLFPIVATDADELLIMYNQWDGCCLGIPPTPYDSVEVKLAKPTGKDAWSYTYGSVKGVLRVDPYISGKWLISLYVLEAAEMETIGL